MKLKNKIAALSTLLILQSFNVADAAAIDDELALIAAEQNKDDEQVETFDPDSVDNDKNKNKSPEEIKEEEKRLEKEREEARKKIKEERKKSRDELEGKTPISKNPAPTERKTENKPAITPPAESAQAVKDPEPVKENPPAVNQPQNVSLPNPILTYASFNEVVQAVNFTPLYVPKKSGYNITAMMTINNRVAEIRYNRKWEPNVSLHVRTYKRAAGEELKDISGVYGVKWRVNVVGGITVYIAKIDENKHVAAWAVGNYTFSAYVENLAFAAFHAFVSDELVDLSTHYYLGD
ncbi:MAG: hypothetical protein IJT73_05295 [Selenomonadaceae bacterium]|nr:hypothetical protein [Selenomonadaceae bacterium]